MWAFNKVFYQIYTLKFCGAPAENDGVVQPRIRKIREWIPYFNDIGVDAVYLCPVFCSDTHGYDTKDYGHLDERLGTDNDLKTLVAEMHKNGIKVILDGVFNHVGRNFAAFADVRENRENSRYRDWFYLDFGRDSQYGDGFYYEGWEGHFELVKLNDENPEVIKYLEDQAVSWIDKYDIDGLRLDVAYSLPDVFLAGLRDVCRGRKEDFFIIGETIDDNYERLLNNMDSVTNYQSYKGLWSSFNSGNLFEIADTFRRQFNEMLPGSHLFNFLDNHDVSRIASKLNDPLLLGPIYGLLFAMPGIPCVYYGSEWRAKGSIDEGQPDDVVRPYFGVPMPDEMTIWIKWLIKLHKENKAFIYGGYRQLYLTNEQLVFERAFEDDRIVVGLNISDTEVHVDFDAGAEQGMDILSGHRHNFGGGTDLAPRSIYYWYIEG
ncbi:MAG: alpha-amylase family glycosyl hydrolase [Eubacteriaceae bacterium]|jgi:glycosidase|nr:alpha-amylase family glycosyl hydrolase [Eubacteriaceae bacterium]